MLCLSASLYSFPMPKASNQDIPEDVSFFHYTAFSLFCLSLSLPQNAVDSFHTQQALNSLCFSHFMVLHLFLPCLVKTCHMKSLNKLFGLFLLFLWWLLFDSYCDHRMLCTMTQLYYHKFLVVFPYYPVKACRICSDVPSLIPHNGNLCLPSSS